VTRDSRYDILFEPVRIGSFTAKNRFYQVPHCNGGGYRDPSAAAAMRGVKAEGGWAVVFTEQCEMHHTSEITPFIELRLWDDRDIPGLAGMADKIHEHGALAGIQLAYSGINGPNLYTREVPMAPTALPIRTFTNDPVSARAMDKGDIADLRRWFVNAFLRAKRAGFDLACLYGAHGFGVFQHFLSTATNHRADEYGGSLENRSRLVREVVSDVRDALGDSMAITLRVSLDEMIGGLGFANSEVRDFIGMHSDLPDVWDLAHGTWEECSATARFSEEAAQQDLVRGIRDLTDKPVVGVGRFTSPDAMVRQVKEGVLDLIGCARPSIADPFLPRKVDEGRVDDIRECIGCNICVTGDMTMSISRCTQNPTFMEEWRKGWHPERIGAGDDSGRALVVGAGPAGLEAARALAVDPAAAVLTPDDVMGGNLPSGRVLVYDDDHYYMGGVLAELLAQSGCEVELVTPAAYVSEWTRNTLEQHSIHKRLAGMGVTLTLNRALSSVGAGAASTECVFTGARSEHGADAVVMVASRVAEDAVWREMKLREAEWADAGIRTVKAIGDAEAPGPIAWATYAGHRYARELDGPDLGDELPFRREIAALAVGGAEIPAGQPAGR